MVSLIIVAVELALDLVHVLLGRVTAEDLLLNFEVSNILLIAF